MTSDAHGESVPGLSGDAIALVLLHAFPLDSSMWDHVAALLPPAIEVIGVDAPGFGGTDATAGGLEEFADDVVRTIVGRGVTNVVVAGVSMGGYVAMALAEREPELLAGLALLSTKASADAAQARENRLAMAAAAEGGEPEVATGMRDALLGETTRAERPTVTDAVAASLRGAPACGIAWAQRAMAARPDRLAVLEALPAGLPALVMRGAEDQLMRESEAQAMATALGVDVTTIPGAGHLLPLEAPVPTAAALRALCELTR